MDKTWVEEETQRVLAASFGAINENPLTTPEMEERAWCSAKDTFYIDPSVEGHDHLCARASNAGLAVRSYLGKGVTVCVASQKQDSPGPGRLPGRRRDRIHQMVYQAQSAKTTRALSISERARELNASVITGVIFASLLEELETTRVGSALERKRGKTGKASLRRVRDGGGVEGVTAVWETSRFTSSEHPRVVIRDLDGLEPDQVQSFPPELLRKCNLHSNAPMGICPFTPVEQWEREVLKLEEKRDRLRRANPPTRQWTTSATQKPRRGGWCECCNIHFTGTEAEHCAGPRHQSFLADGSNFVALMQFEDSMKAERMARAAAAGKGDHKHGNISSPQGMLRSREGDSLSTVRSTLGDGEPDESSNVEEMSCKGDTNTTTGEQRMDQSKEHVPLLSQAVGRRDLLLSTSEASPGGPKSTTVCAENAIGLEQDRGPGAVVGQISVMAPRDFPEGAEGGPVEEERTGSNAKEVCYTVTLPSSRVAGIDTVASQGLLSLKPAVEPSHEVVLPHSALHNIEPDVSAPSPSRAACGPDLRVEDGLVSAIPEMGGVDGVVLAAMPLPGPMKNDTNSKAQGWELRGVEKSILRSMMRVASWVKPDPLARSIVGGGRSRAGMEGGTGQDQVCGWDMLLRGSPGGGVGEASPQKDKGWEGNITLDQGRTACEPNTSPAMSWEEWLAISPNPKRQRQRWVTGDPQGTPSSHRVTKNPHQETSVDNPPAQSRVRTPHGVGKRRPLQAAMGPVTPWQCPLSQCTRSKRSLCGWEKGPQLTKDGRTCSQGSPCSQDSASPPEPRRSSQEHSAAGCNSTTAPQKSKRSGLRRKRNPSWAVGAGVMPWQQPLTQLSGLSLFPSPDLELGNTSTSTSISPSGCGRAGCVLLEEGHSQTEPGVSGKCRSPEDVGSGRTGELTSDIKGGESEPRSAPSIPGREMDNPFQRLENLPSSRRDVCSNASKVERDTDHGYTATDVSGSGRSSGKGKVKRDPKGSDQALVRKSERSCSQKGHLQGVVGPVTPWQLPGRKVGTTGLGDPPHQSVTGWLSSIANTTSTTVGGQPSKGSGHPPGSHLQSQECKDPARKSETVHQHRIGPPGRVTEITFSSSTSAHHGMVIPWQQSEGSGVQEGVEVGDGFSAGKAGSASLIGGTHKAAMFWQQPDLASERGNGEIEAQARTGPRRYSAPPSLQGEGGQVQGWEAPINYVLESRGWDEVGFGHLAGQAQGWEVPANHVLGGRGSDDLGFGHLAVGLDVNCDKQKGLHLEHQGCSALRCKDRRIGTSQGGSGSCSRNMGKDQDHRR
ncbi:unnamed protein product [Discosporangium mesarthrocarpum]